jgi:hypothetical protein
MSSEIGAYIRYKIEIEIEIREYITPLPACFVNRNSLFILAGNLLHQHYLLSTEAVAWYPYLAWPADGDPCVPMTYLSAATMNVVAASAALLAPTNTTTTRTLVAVPYHVASALASSQAEFVLRTCWVLFFLEYAKDLCIITLRRRVQTTCL